MNKRTIIIITTIMVAIPILVIVFKWYMDKINSIDEKELYEVNETDIYMKMVIFPTGIFDNTYYFVLTNDASLFCYKGTRKSDDIRRIDFTELFEERKKIEISEHDFQYMVELLENMKKDLPEEKGFAWDSWNIALMYDNKIYEADYFLNKSETLKKITKKIVELSPLSINLPS